MHAVGCGIAAQLMGNIRVHDTKLEDCTDSDFEFAFEAKKQALGPYIIEKWGWEEKYQREVHKQRWRDKPWSLIIFETSPIGTVSFQNTDDQYTRFGEFYILEKFQGRGIGTKVLKSFLSECDLNQKWARLEYLKWNPVGSLYKRNGFRVVDENEIHLFLERKSNTY